MQRESALPLCLADDIPFRTKTEHFKNKSMRSTHLGYWGRFIWVVVEVREAILEQNIQISFSNRE